MREKIIEIIRRQLKIDKTVNLSDDMGPGSMPEWDSLENMKLIAMLEKELNVHFEFDDILEMSSIGSIISVYEKKYTEKV